MNSDEFSICALHSICTGALDMLPCGNENSYHIEFEQSENKNIEQTFSLHIDKNVFASKPYVLQCRILRKGVVKCEE